MIPYGKQEITKTDIDAVVKVLNSDFLTQGPVVPQFEKIVAEYCNVEHTVAVNSATSALHIACLALGLGKGDYLWTSPNTFVASANCGLYCGAKIGFIDIDHKTYNISSQALEEKLVQAEKNGKLPKVVIPVHFAGQACEMEKIHQLSKKYGFKIIEDASHAIGGKYQNRQIGSCLYGDITIFSFHPVKIITTGEGGMASTNSPVLAEKMRLLRSHGVTRDARLMTKQSEGAWYYQQIDLGFNYRMTDIQAALGISQIDRLDDFIKRRHQIAQCYDKAFEALSVTSPQQHADTWSSYHLYPIRINQGVCGVTQRQVYDFMQKADFNVNLHYIPVYRQPYYEAMGFKAGYCREAEEYYKETLSIPIYPALTDTDQARVIDVLHEVLS